MYFVAFERSQIGESKTEGTKAGSQMYSNGSDENQSFPGHQ
mgnify:CR=1 FL=1